MPRTPITRLPRLSSASDLFPIAPMPSISQRTHHRPEEGFWFLPMPTPSGVPVAIRSPGSSVKAVEIFDLLVDLVDHLGRIARLAQIPVDVAPQIQICGSSTSSQYDPRTDRPVRVERRPIVKGGNNCQSCADTSFATK